MAKGDWVRVTKRSPCPVCGKPDFCGVSNDGAICHCMRVESDWPAKKGGGWMHRLDQPLNLPVQRDQKPEPIRTDEELDRQWRPLLETHRLNLSSNGLKIADDLGVSVAAVESLEVGWDGSAYWFPERNIDGFIIGINRRFPDGKKICATGSRRGLTYSLQHIMPWFDTCCRDPLFVVEGGSDVLAGLSLGLRIIGRPSNVGGTELLQRFIGRREGKIPPIYVLGERDRKRHEDLHPKIQERHNPQCTGCMSCWPGYYGAVQLAKSLRNAAAVLLPDNKKDLRAWLVRCRKLQPFDFSDQEAVSRMREYFLKQIGESAL